MIRLNLIRRASARVLLFTAACAALSGCASKKKTTTTGGGSAWLVGEDGLMADVRPSGELGAGYDLDGSADLRGITCRGLDTAFVVGAAGTMLRTTDAGATWQAIDLGTTAELRSVASAGPATIYVAGDRALLMSPDSGDSWVPVDAARAWLAVTANHAGDRVLALDGDGAVWAYDAAHHALVPAANLPGARTVSVSHDGAHAAVVGVGDAILRSDDGGVTWRAVELGRAVALDDVWATGAGDLIAVGEAGTIVRVDAHDAVAFSQVGTAALHAVHVDATGVGFAAGDGGAVVLSVDGGRGWRRLPVVLPGTVLGVDAVTGDGHL